MGVATASTIFGEEVLENDEEGRDCVTISKWDFVISTRFQTPFRFRIVIPLRWVVRRGPLLLFYVFFVGLAVILRSFEIWICLLNTCSWLKSRIEFYRWVIVRNTVLCKYYRISIVMVNFIRGCFTYTGINFRGWERRCVTWRGKFWKNIARLFHDSSLNLNEDYFKIF